MAVRVSIHKSFGDFVMDVRFQSESRRIGILGASGSGKSMTLKSIAGIETPDEGHIECGGIIFYDSDTKTNMKTQKRKVGYLFQNYALFPNMTVEKNIGAGLKTSGSQKRKRVGEMIQKFRLEGLEKRLPSQLSGGQQQRVALARIMAYEPDIILLDEPFSALDMFLKDQLQRELTEMLDDYSGTVILVSHNRDEIYRFSEEVLIMDRGHVVTSGKTKDIFANPVSREAAKLTGCKNFTRIRREDAHTALALDWKIRIHTERNIPEDAGWIGYRAHDFVPVWGAQGSNMLKVCLKGTAELPFERNYYIGAGKDTVCWFVQREKISEIELKGMPDFLKLEEEKILFLK